ncbi:MAG: hypothetical protein RIT45_555 [Pseudomonadota bacterium]|jgi:hypothetical protein
MLVRSLTSIRPALRILAAAAAAAAALAGCSAGHGGVGRHRPAHDATPPARPTQVALAAGAEFATHRGGPIVARLPKFPTRFPMPMAFGLVERAGDWVAVSPLPRRKDA